jgi:hypothetical protein
MTDTARLRELLAKATPGPWVDTGDENDTVAAADGLPVCYYVGVQNAALIVEAVNALPGLLDDLGAAREQARAALQSRKETS